MTCAVVVVYGAVWLALGVMGDESKSLRSKGVYVIPQENTSSVKLLVAAFARSALSPLQVEGIDTFSWDAVAAHADDFDLVWSLSPLQFAQLGKLSPRHKVNQLPGHDILTTATQWNARYMLLQKHHGPYDFGFMPPEFYLPRHKDAFVKAFDAMRTIARFSDRLKVDAYYKRRWLVTKTPTDQAPSKSFNILIDLRQLEAQQDQQLRVVHVVEPMLFSGHKAHVGVFVVVTSLDPLRIYIFHNVLLRISRLKYPTVLETSSPRASFQVSDRAADWLPPWEVDDLRDHYKELPSSQSEGTSHLKVLLQQLDHAGVDVAKFQKDMHGNVVKIIASCRSHWIKQARQANLPPQNFFHLFRFDMEIEDTGKPWVVGVNAHPSLEPHEFGSGSTEGFFASLANDMVRLLGVQAPRDKTPEQLVVQASPAHCATKCDDRMRVWDMTCWRCPGWFAPPVATALYASATEYSRRSRFHLAFPTTKGEYAEFIDGGLSAADHAFYAYLMSFGVDDATTDINHDTAKWDPSVLCVNRAQCSHRGNCINGRCHCDAGYEGNTCYIPLDPASMNLPSRSIRHQAVNTADEEASNRVDGGVISYTEWAVIVVGLALACYGGYRAALHVVKTQEMEEKDN
ncbi:hypothetical protein H310_01028 [Aphanomyces invadans]|uniref:Tubulin--tyrosine ligase-like protein 5 n=1 Tax=Aphanomyces invadans TaxID=157072 RepID=A0A024US65_9STRA|nr:hypothetical protein H310_01028 [Aphanomyces invadans]ETW08448.1 hypothetical protein H310_01028 [Aphanomyces invadans]|eukprot:XP_008862253.1 hypothetical protein H310_01028 [Aphanomyces invadans]